jgi:hypothetical protein
VTQPRVPGLDPAIQERAALTDAQATALSLWDPCRLEGPHGAQKSLIFGQEPAPVPALGARYPDEPAVQARNP